MRNYNIYLLAKLLNEELNSKDLKFYNKIESTNDYTLYIDKHLSKRKTRNYEWRGSNSDIITNNKILKSFHKAYSKILALYSSNKLEFSNNSSQAFAIIDKSYYDDLVIIGFIYGVDKNTGNYDICLKTVIFKNDFKCKNNTNTKTLPVIIKESFKEIENIIIVEND